jgi:hypothetical protein
MFTVFQPATIRNQQIWAWLKILAKHIDDWNCILKFKVVWDSEAQVYPKNYLDLNRESAFLRSLIRLWSRRSSQKSMMKALRETWPAGHSANLWCPGPPGGTLENAAEKQRHEEPERSKLRSLESYPVILSSSLLLVLWLYAFYGLVTVNS